MLADTFRGLPAEQGEFMMSFADCYGAILILAYALITCPLATGQGNTTPRDLYFQTQPQVGDTAQNAPTQRCSAAPQATPTTRVPDQDRRRWSLQYGILQIESSGSLIGVNPSETLFHAGDRIRIHAEANQRIYLTIVELGTSGKWSLLFPSPTINEGQSMLAPFYFCDIPESPTSGFVFDDLAGAEEVFLIVSLDYIDLGSLVSYLNHQQVGGPDDQPLSSREIKILRDLTQPAVIRSRDLIFEKAEEYSLDNFKGTIFYASNASTESDAPQVIHFTLNHAGRQ